MGKVWSVFSRTLQRYNVESRAHKVISKDKPTAAPRHKQSAKELEMMKQVDSDFLKKHNTKDPKLDDRLKEVYLVSHATEMMEKLNPPDPNRPLPTRRTTADELEYGVHEPTEVRRGRCTLRQAMEFLTNHNTDPAQHTAAAISAEYKLRLDVTSNILKYFRPFKIYIPEKKPAEKLKMPEIKWPKIEPPKLQ